MKITILDPQAVLYEGVVSAVQLPVSDGEWCVMDFHEPFVARMVKGVVYSEQVLTVAIKTGIARMSGNELILLVIR